MSTAVVLEGDAAGYLADCAERLARSEVVAWLLKNHDAVVAATKRRTLRWEELAHHLFKDGVRNLRGRAPAGPSLRVTWYRVRKFVIEQRQEAQAAAERQAEEEARQEARKAAARAEESRKAGDAGRLREKMRVAQETATWEREQDRRRRDEQARATIAQGSRDVAAGAGPGEAPAAAAPAEGGGHLVMLDLQRLPGVSSRAYLPHDPTLPPVREGEICRATGLRWEIGDDLPGYPSKRNYEYEIDWLRDVGRLLRARHPTNPTMSWEEKYVIRTAEARLPNLYY
jgi:hypothetical protein